MRSRADGTAVFYDAVYKTYPTMDPDCRYGEQRAVLCAAMSQLDLPSSAVVVEVGAGLGFLSDVHPNYVGVEQSVEAVRRVREAYGSARNVVQGDATALDFPDSSVDFLFSFDTLEHVPNVDQAFAEIARVLKPGGHAFLKPAWNCRSWTVKKLQQRPYKGLSMSEKAGKFLIPLRENIVYRAAQSLPGRLRRELALKMKRSLKFVWRPLSPAISGNIGWKDGIPVTTDNYPHLPDEDAYASLDPQAVLAWFLSEGWRLLSHPTMVSRLKARSEGILVQKPIGPYRASGGNGS